MDINKINFISLGILGAIYSYSKFYVLDLRNIEYQKFNDAFNILLKNYDKFNETKALKTTLKTLYEKLNILNKKCFYINKDI